MASANTYYWLEEHVDIYAQSPRPSRDQDPCLIHGDQWADAVASLFTSLEQSILPNCGELRSRAEKIVCTCEGQSLDEACNQLLARCGGNKLTTEQEFFVDLQRYYHNMLNNARRLQLMNLTERPCNTIENFIKISPIIEKLFTELFVNDNKSVVPLLHAIRQYIMKPFKGSFVVPLPLSADNLRQFCDGNFIEDLITSTGCDMFLDFKPSTPSETELNFYVEAACLADFNHIKEALVEHADNILNPKPAEVKDVDADESADGSSEASPSEEGTSDGQSDKPADASDKADGDTDKPDDAASTSENQPDTTGSHSQPEGASDASNASQSAAESADVAAGGQAEKPIENDSLMVDIEDKVNEADIEMWEDLQEMEIASELSWSEVVSDTANAELTIQLPPTELDSDAAGGGPHGSNNNNQNNSAVAATIDNPEQEHENQNNGDIVSASHENSDNNQFAGHDLARDEHSDDSRAAGHDSVSNENSNNSQSTGHRTASSEHSQDGQPASYDSATNENSNNSHSASNDSTSNEYSEHSQSQVHEVHTPVNGNDIQAGGDAQNDVPSHEAETDANENPTDDGRTAMAAASLEAAQMDAASHIPSVTREEMEDSGVSLSSDTDSTHDTNLPEMPSKIEQNHMIRDDRNVISHLEDEIVQMKIKIYHQMLTTDVS